MSCLITMSQKELHRLEVIQKIRDERLSVIQGAELLDLSRSQVHRLLQAYDLDGPAGLISKKRSRPSNRRHSEEFRNAAQHMPGEEAWLVGEWRSNGERKYYLANLPADTTLKRLAGAIKARWVCEQAHQQMKEELGLDHFEGRSWKGLHRHALMTMIAYAFLQHHRLQIAKREKKEEAPTERAA